MEKYPFSDGSRWWVADEYKFIHKNYLVPEESKKWPDEFTIYNPLEPNDLDGFPHIDLKRVDTESKADMKKFVEKWGLLGIKQALVAPIKKNSKSKIKKKHKDKIKYIHQNPSKRINKKEMSAQNSSLSVLFSIYPPEVWEERNDLRKIKESLHKNYKISQNIKFTELKDTNLNQETNSEPGYLCLEFKNKEKESPKIKWTIVNNHDGIPHISEIYGEWLTKGIPEGHIGPSFPSLVKKFQNMCELLDRDIDETNVSESDLESFLWSPENVTPTLKSIKRRTPFTPNNQPSKNFVPPYKIVYRFNSLLDACYLAVMLDEDEDRLNKCPECKHWWRDDDDHHGQRTFCPSDQQEFNELESSCERNANRRKGNQVSTWRNMLNHEIERSSNISENELPKEAFTAQSNFEKYSHPFNWHKKELFKDLPSKFENLAKKFAFRRFETSKRKHDYLLEPFLKEEEIERINSKKNL